MSNPISITPEQVESLARYLPILLRGWIEIVHWHYSQRDGRLTLPHPEYSRVVERFFLEAAMICSSLEEYDRDECSRLVKDPTQIRQASLQAAAELLWYCCRGERFCDGFWSAMIRKGVIMAAVTRLQELVCA